MTPANGTTKEAKSQSRFWVAVVAVQVIFLIALGWLWSLEPSSPANQKVTSMANVGIVATFIVYAVQARLMFRQLKALHDQSAAVTEQLGMASDQLAMTRDQLAIMREQQHAMDRQITASLEVARNQNLMNFVTFLQEPEMRISRRILYKLRDHNTPMRNWSQGQREAAERVCAAFALAGTYAREDILPERHFLEHYRGAILKCFHTALPFLDELRSDRGADLWKGFDWLAELAAGKEDALAFKKLCALAREPRTGETLGTHEENVLMGVKQ